MTQTSGYDFISSQVHALIMSVWGRRDIQPTQVASTLLAGAMWVVATHLGSNAEAMEWLRDFADNGEHPPHDPRPRLN